MVFPYGGAHQGQSLQGIILNHFGQPTTCLGYTSRGSSTPWNGNIPTGGNGPLNMNSNWSNHLQMSGNALVGYPPTNPSTLSGGNSTPQTTTMSGEIPPINPIPNISGIGLGSNQSSGSLLP